MPKRPQAQKRKRLAGDADNGRFEAKLGKQMQAKGGPASKAGS